MNPPHPLPHSSADAAIEHYTFSAPTTGIEVKPLDFLLQKRDMTTCVHRTTFHQLLWVQRGTLVLDVDFQHILVESGQCCFIGVGQVCRFDVDASFAPSPAALQSLASNAPTSRVSSAVEGLSLLLEPEFLGEISDDRLLLRALSAPFLSPQALTPPDAAAFEVLFSQLHAVALSATPQPFALTTLRSYVRLLLSALVAATAAAQTSHAPNPLSQQYLDAVEAHYHHWHNVAQYLPTLGATEKALSAAVKQHTGFTPKTYLDQRRVLEAKRLLAHSPLSAKEIAYDLGFDEPTNFHKFFRKHTQLTPQEFRQKYVNI